MVSVEDIEATSIPGFREPVNCFTHLLAAIVFSILSVYLIRRGRGSWVRTASLAVMAFSSVFLLSMSAVYHLLGAGAGRDVLRQLDIAGVFALIAGTMTPVHAILDTGFTRWASLAVVWSAAAAGITLTTVFSDSLPSGVGIAIFLLFGWGGLISFIRLWRRYGFSFVTPLLWGGVAYTLGAVALGANWPIPIPRVVGAHEVWHLAVVAGLILHWKFVFQFAQGPPNALPPASNTPLSTIQSH
jgi:channel protein (hemolysin III family)